MTLSALDIVLQHEELADLDPARRRLALRELVPEMRARGCRVDVSQLAEDIDGYGPLSALMRDPEVTDILVNQPGDVWVERSGRLDRAAVAFDDEGELRAFIERCLGRAGRRADISEPIADAALPDGSRMHVVLPPIARDGPLVSIRRIPRIRYALSELVDRSMLTAREARFLTEAVHSRSTIAVSGGTGSGKTTLVNALLSLVQAGERVVVIEETPELAPACAHAVCLTTRNKNVAGVGAVDAADLVRAALRMRPDRIVIGEVRGAEALAALSAMSTGHEGSMVTLHARSADDAVRRMVALALQAGGGASESSLEAQFAAAFDVLVHLERAGGRRVAAIRAG